MSFTGQAAIAKHHGLGGLSTGGMCFSQSRGWKSGTRVPHGQGLGSVHFWGVDWRSPSTHMSGETERERGSKLRGDSYKGGNCIHDLT